MSSAVWALTGVAVGFLLTLTVQKMERRGGD